MQEIALLQHTTSRRSSCLPKLRNEVLQSVAISNFDLSVEQLPKTHHAFLAIVSNNAKACIHGRWRAQLQLTTSQVSVNPVWCKANQGMCYHNIFTCRSLSHCVSSCCMSLCTVFCGAMMSVPWRQAAGRSAKSSTANCQWLLADTLMKPRSDATWHDIMVIYGDIVVVYDYILRYDVNTINHNWNTIFVELFLYHHCSTSALILFRQIS